MNLASLPTIKRALCATGIASLTLVALATESGAVTFEPPETSAPRQSTGGASRSGGLCPDELIAGGDRLVPLIPETNHGYTTVDRPTVFVYVPETSATEAYFSLEDDTQTPLFQMNVPVPAEGGLVAVELPESAPAIEAGKEYQWYFTLKCNGRIRAGYPLVGGWISRYDGEVTVGESAIDAADAYGRAGVWYDGLSALALAAQAEPTNEMLTNSLEEFLASAGLNDVADRIDDR